MWPLFRFWPKSRKIWNISGLFVLNPMTIFEIVVQAVRGNVPVKIDVTTSRSIIWSILIKTQKCDLRSDLDPKSRKTWNICGLFVLNPMTIFEIVVQTVRGNVPVEIDVTTSRSIIWSLLIKTKKCDLYSGFDQNLGKSEISLVYSS